MKDNLHLEIKKCFEDSIEGLRDSTELNFTIERCIKKAFENADKKYKEMHQEVANSCGATAVVCILLGNKLVCANVGDARAILCRNAKALDLSADHKAVKILFYNLTYSQERMNKNAFENKVDILFLGEFWVDSQWLELLGILIAKILKWLMIIKKKRLKILC